MKHLIIICGLFITGNCYSQKDTVGLLMPFKDGRLIYEEVVNAPGVQKSTMYKNTKQWFVDEFKSSKDVIQNEDKEDGKIIGKGIIPVKYNTWIGPNMMTCLLTIQVECKDNKFRYRIYDMLLRSPSLGEFTPEYLIDGIFGKLPPNNKTYTKKVSISILKSIHNEAIFTTSSLKKKIIKISDDF